MYRSTVFFSRTCFAKSTFSTAKLTRSFSVVAALKMPEKLTKEEALNRDPTVAKQYDNETSTEQKWKDLYAIADKLGICLMGTARPGLGVRLYLKPQHHIFNR